MDKMEKSVKMSIWGQSPNGHQNGHEWIPKWKKRNGENENRNINPKSNRWNNK